MSQSSIINLIDSSQEESTSDIICIDITSSENKSGTATTWTCHFCTFYNVTNNNVFSCSMCGLPNEALQASSAAKHDDTSFTTRSSVSNSVVTSTSNNYSAITPSLSTSSSSSSVLSYNPEHDRHITRNVIPLLYQQIKHTLQTIPLYLQPYTLSLCSNFDHYSQYDGYTCGYRNIQILCSALLRKNEYRNILFGGCGYVPNVESLQRIIEYAWSIGFDPVGYDELKTILHTNKFIGSAECTVLLRFFGIPAQLIAFHSLDDPLFDTLVQKQKESLSTNTTTSSTSNHPSPKSSNNNNNDPVLNSTIIENVLQARIDAESNRQDFLRCHYSSNNNKSKIENAISKNALISTMLEENPDIMEQAIHEAENIMSTMSSSGEYNKRINAQKLTPIHRKYLQQRHSGLLKWLSSIFQNYNISSHFLQESTINTHDEIINITLPFPIYFQHDGHSRTLIGWEIRPVQSSVTKRKGDQSVSSMSKKRKDPITSNSNTYQSTLLQYLPSSSNNTTVSNNLNDDINNSAFDSETNIDNDDNESIQTNTDMEIFLLIADPMTDTKTMMQIINPLSTTNPSTSLLNDNINIPSTSSSSSSLSNSTTTNTTSRSKSSWPSIIKRGLHTLRKPIYEVVYVPIDAKPVPIGSKEWEELKAVKEQHYWSGYDKFNAEIFSKR